MNNTPINIVDVSAPTWFEWAAGVAFGLLLIMGALYLIHLATRKKKKRPKMKEIKFKNLPWE